MKKKAPTVRAWEVIEGVNLLVAHTVLRVRVEYENGRTHLLTPCFTTRTEVDMYIGRFHPEFKDKERPGRFSRPS